MTHQSVFSIVNREYLFNDISIDNLLTAAYLERERFAVSDTIVHHANENKIFDNKRRNNFDSLHIQLGRHVKIHQGVMRR